MRLDRAVLRDSWVLSVRRSAFVLAVSAALLGGAVTAAAAERAKRVTLVWGGDVTLGSSYGRPPARGWPQLAGLAPILRRADFASVNYEGTFGSGGRSKCGSGSPNCF